MWTWPEVVEGRDRYLPGFRFAGGDPFSRAFDAVIRTVANQMRQRIADCLDQLTIKLGIRAFDDKIKFLLQIDRQISNHARDAGKEPRHRLHTGSHDGVLQIGCHRRQPFQRALDLAYIMLTRQIHDLIAGQNEFGHEIHDPLNSGNR